MKVIQLATLKALAKVTFSAQDTALTAVANGVEADVEKFLVLDLDDLTDAQSSGIEYNLTAAAVLKWQSAGHDIWEKGILARALSHLRSPPLGTGSTS